MVPLKVFVLVQTDLETDEDHVLGVVRKVTEAASWMRKEGRRVYYEFDIGEIFTLERVLK